MVSTQERNATQILDEVAKLAVMSVTQLETYGLEKVQAALDSHRRLKDALLKGG